MFFSTEAASTMNSGVADERMSAEFSTLQHSKLADTASLTGVRESTRKRDSSTRPTDMSSPVIAPSSSSSSSSSIRSVSSATKIAKRIGVSVLPPCTFCHKTSDASSLACETKYCSAIYHQVCVAPAVEEVIALYPQALARECLCPQCFKEEAEYEKLQQRYAGNSEFRSIFIDWKMEFKKELEITELQTVEKILSGRPVDGLESPEEQAAYIITRLKKKSQYN